MKNKIKDWLQKNKQVRKDLKSAAKASAAKMFLLDKAPVAEKLLPQVTPAAEEP